MSVKAIQSIFIILDSKITRPVKSHCLILILHSVAALTLKVIFNV